LSSTKGLYDDVLTSEDCLNIRKWVTATGMMIEAKLRTTWSDSERQTWEKVKRIEIALVRLDREEAEEP